MAKLTARGCKEIGRVIGIRTYQEEDSFGRHVQHQVTLAVRSDGAILRRVRVVLDGKPDPWRTFTIWKHFKEGVEHSVEPLVTVLERQGYEVQEVKGRKS